MFPQSVSDDSFCEWTGHKLHSDGCMVIDPLMCITLTVWFVQRCPAIELNGLDNCVFIHGKTFVTLLCIQYSQVFYESFNRQIHCFITLCSVAGFPDCSHLIKRMYLCNKIYIEYE